MAKLQKKNSVARPNAVVDLRPAFLAAYRATASVTRAAEAIGIDRRTHYLWLEDEQYRADFEAAQRDAAQLLEDEAIRRAVEGVEEPVIYQGALCFAWDDLIDEETGEVIGTKKSDRPLVVRKYSDGLLQFMLRGFNPTKYRENVKAEITGAVDIVSVLAAARARLQSDNKES